MRRPLIGILSLLCFSLLFAVPVSAVDLPQCAPFPNETTEFVLIADDNVIFELQAKGSGREINGNVLVTNPTPKNVGSSTGTGFAKVGANTVINGTLIADTILLPDGGATITHCIANTIVANTAAAKASCGTGFPVVPGNTFTDYAAAHPGCVGSPLGDLALCGPAPVADTCANTAPPLTVPAGQTLTMPPSPIAPPNRTCFGALRLEHDSTLILTGTFTFKSIQMDTLSTLRSGSAGTAATVNVNNTVIASAPVNITDINLNVALKTAAEVVQIFNNSKLENVLINAVFGKCHIHTGTDLTCSEACCKVLDVEPITAECGIGEFCACKQGFKFEFPPLAGPPAPGSDPTTARNCVPCGPNDHPPAFPTCNP